MTLIVQKPGLTIAGKERESGWVVPKDVENDPSNSFRQLVSRGSVIKLPDQLFDNIHTSKNDVDLSQNVNDVQNDLDDVASIEQLNRIEKRESNGKDRKTVHQAIQDKRDEIN